MTSNSILNNEQQSAIPEDSVLLTETEVSNITGYSARTLQHHRQNRRGIPFVRLSHNKVRYRPSDVWSHIDNLRVETKEATQ
ncbi:MAG: hypothetical protein LC541_18265 [Candidatus Thiodiazotropha sp.]|nr:hypothetical protein [Candidatus Thiodiazotropha sp.]MCM8885215.1 hypothetical protein [Candidatus Thiodiazotropha sp.]MCM8921003.1 hypothetical protein [Candidatus Thiodiazotropha sp.]